MISTVLVRFAAAVYLTAAIACGAITSTHRAALEVTQDLHNTDYGKEIMPAILLSVWEGPAGEDALRAWSAWASDVVISNNKLPPVWVICSNAASIASVNRLSHMNPFIVDDVSSWAEVLTRFLSLNEHVSAVGLLGEGSMPHRDLARSIESMYQALSKAASPTAILTRARSRSDVAVEEQWLSDKFVSQIWCNRAVLKSTLLAGAGLKAWAVQDWTFLQVLPRLIHNSKSDQVVLVDGTQVLKSIFAATPSAGDSVNSSNLLPQAGKGHQWIPDDKTAASEGEGPDLYIGSLEFALVFDATGNAARGRPGSRVIKTSSIVKAPWPPEYVLKTVASKAGLVVVTNVNCGYVDMAMNFWLSVQRTSDAKVQISRLCWNRTC